MPALAARDTERLLAFVADAETLGGDQLFSPDSLVELGRLIDADWVCYSELDRVRRREILYVCRPGEEEAADDVDLYWDIEQEHPICSRQSSGIVGAIKMSDFVSLRELRQSRLYDLWLQPFGIERQLAIALPSPRSHTKVLMFDRSKGRRDFSERDRLILNRLGPHLARLWRAARTRRLLEGALTELDHAEEHADRGLILLGAAGQIDYASPPAARLLRDFFPPRTGDGLPSAVVDWLETGADRPLERRLGEHTLAVEQSSDSLVLVQRREEVELTARERDVLSWVARGKTNPEIAELLWLAPSTVRKHLENIYAKLGVSTRTAAVAKFIGLSDAQAS